MTMCLYDSCKRNGELFYSIINIEIFVLNQIVFGENYLGTLRRKYIIILHADILCVACSLIINN